MNASNTTTVDLSPAAQAALWAAFDATEVVTTVDLSADAQAAAWAAFDSL